jgi:hypothetical protein
VKRCINFADAIMARELYTSEIAGI